MSKGKRSAAKAQGTVAAAPAVRYGVGKPYHVRPGTQLGNDVSWGLVSAQLAKGPATQAQLVELLTARNHKNFVGYAIRRGWLAPVAQ